MGEKLRVSKWKSILFVLVLSTACLLLLEVTSRLLAFVAYGFSPYYLVYGFVGGYFEGKEGHNTAYDGYFKFPPSRTLHQYGLFHEATPIRINNLGYRGRDLAPTKDEATFRVVCMGGSSTFGFYNRDDHTYPALLQERLRERLAEQSIEVLNAGIPHSTSYNILAMLDKEILLRYKPNVVTFYEAFNDAGNVFDESWIQAAGRWAHGHVATYVALKRVVEAAGGPILHSRWAGYLPRSTADYVRRQIELHRELYDRNIRALVRDARQAGAQLVLIRQPMTTKQSHDHPHGPPDRFLTYEGEVQWIRNNLSRHGWVSSIEALMLVHHALITVLDRVAEQEHARVVDNITIVNQHPEFFASYVHLSEVGNAALAEALSEVIVPLVEQSGR